jgi:hypothetical protein
LPRILSALEASKPGERAALVVEGTVIEFERMTGESGWKATGSNRAIWNRMPLPAFIRLALATQIPISRTLDHPPPSDSARLKEAPRRRLSEGCFVGVDVGGRAEKGYTLARTVWRGGRLASIDFGSLPHYDVLPPTNELRPLVRAGDLDELARRTHETARARQGSLGRARRLGSGWSLHRLAVGLRSECRRAWPAMREGLDS